SICSKPQVLSRHYSKEKDVMVQDETCKLYLFDKSGKRQFVKQLDGVMTSPIYQIDLYGNSKKQYVFATENMLHAIDRNGNYLDNFPVQLPAKVSTEISVFDYDNTLDYRIFVPCSDGYLYVYTKEGKPLDTWTPYHTNYPIVTPVQFFRIGDNDYLVAADQLKPCILNRRGEVRINVTNSFPKAKNSLFYVENPNTPDMRFVTTTSSGEVKYIYTDGSCQSKNFGTFTADHYFVYHDIDGDGNAEYIFTDGNKLFVYHANGDEMFSYYADGSLGRPNIFTFSSKDIRIGVTCRSLGEIYLLDKQGKLCKGFPLQGKSEFSITKLNDYSKYSVLVGNTDNYLYNYLIN
ncbi:MAG: VCBS repeat-containing protein, partial [Bacteroidales bacterium]|nr:VCBS repeat-containing protein [Bacteroidales bacterium]